MIKLATALLLGVLLGAVSSYTLRDRYTVTPINNIDAYQVDNITGRTWLLHGNIRLELELKK
jgi:hypothetical protein